MPKFQFKAKNEAGELVQGTRVRVSQKELVAALRNERLVVFSVIEEGNTSAPAVAAFTGAAKDKSKSAVKLKTKGGAITYKDIAIFCRQLATLINAGVSILDAIEDVAGMVNNQSFQIMLRKIGADIREGATLSEAMKKHQKVFGNVFTALIAAGEKGGQLGKILMCLI